MATETIATIMITLLCCIIMAVLDVVICGLLNLIGVVSFKKAFLWGLCSLVLPPLFIIYGSLIGRNRLEVTEVELAFNNLPESFDGYRIVQISDIHARSFEGREGQFAKAVNMINSLDADLIAFTGDLITLSPDEISPLEHSLRILKAKDGVISILGNHDYSMYSDVDQATKDEDLQRLITRQKELGWDLLLNENRTICSGADSIAVIGVENTSTSHYFPSKGDLTKASEGTDGLFRILLSHDPMHWDSEVVGKDYPLMLSGHTHAMQVSLLGWCPSSLMFKQYRGLYTKDDQHLYVNIGLGETIFPARIGTRPEITVIKLSKK